MSFARGDAVMRDARERLLDIQEAVERIEKYAGRGREAFEQDELIQTWVLHYFLYFDSFPAAAARPNREDKQIHSGQPENQQNNSRRQENPRFDRIVQK